MIGRSPRALDLRTDQAHTARMYDYLIGGKTNYPADREAAARVLAGNPTVRVAALANRSFLHRCVYRLAADHGVRQFLDVGTGIPTTPNTHEIAQRVDPTARVVYVDNDLIVLAHARALMISSREGTTSFADADLRDPSTILENSELRAALDFDQPIALMLVAILHFVPDHHDPHALVRELVDALPSGSFVVLSHATGDYASERWRRVVQAYGEYGLPAQVRDAHEIGRFVDGLDVLEPGVRLVTRWWPDASEAHLADEDVSFYGVVARKP